MKLIESIQNDEILREDKMLTELVACLLYQEKRNFLTLEEFVFLEILKMDELK